MNARDVAALVVHDVVKQKAHAKESLERAFSKFALNFRDRAFCTELTYGTLRFWSPILVSLQNASNKKRKIDRRIVAHLGVAAYQILYMPSVPSRAAVHSAVDAVKRVRREHVGFANAILRKLSGPEQKPLHETLKGEASIDEVAEAYGLPLFAARAYIGERPDARDILSALCARPSLGVRILKVGFQDALLAYWSASGAYQKHKFVKVN